MSVPLKIENIQFKLNLSYNFSIFTSSEINDNDPIYKLLLEYRDIENIQKIDKKEITKFLYFNRNHVHKILLDSDDIINFIYEENNKHLCFYFYLFLLIKDNPYILNYTYDFDYIKVINDNQEQNNEIYNKLIISRIIIELSNDFKSINDCFNDENEEKINKIINYNIQIIKDNINILKDMDINYTEEEFCSKSIDLIYIDIIIALIKQKKLEEYDFTYDIIKQLNLENIDITKIMFDKLYDVLIRKEDYITDYIISNSDDFSKENKINFYYFLLNYFLKYSIYIYQIPFLFEKKKNIKEILRTNNNISIKDLNNDIERRLKNIIEIFNDSDNFTLIKKKKRVKKGKNLKSIIKDYFNSNTEEENNELSFKSAALSSSFLFEQKSSKELQNIEENSELNNLLYVKNLLSNEKTKKIMENSVKSLVYYFDNDTLLKLLKVCKNDEEKFKEIITNDKFKNFFKEEKMEFKDIIDKVFYFEEPNEKLNKLRQNLPSEVNKQSIENFKNWINNEKNMIKTGK